MMKRLDKGCLSKPRSWLMRCGLLSRGKQLRKRAAEAEERRIAEENYRKMADEKWCTDLRRLAELQKLADEKKMKEDTEEKKRQLEKSVSWIE